MKKALISGITGQDGSYLAELLLDKGYEVYGLARRSSSNNNLDRIAHILGRITLVSGDLSDTASLITAIQTSQPDEVYNLAAQSFAPISFVQPIYTIETDGVGVVRLLDAIHGVKPDARFFQASSSEMFGESKNTPQNERTPFHPRNPYGAAKALAHHIAINYRETYNLFTVCGILFPHESERRSIEFVSRKVTQAVARIKLGLQPDLQLGNLDTRRDWGYAQDYVEAIWQMLQEDTPTEYVIASGQTHTVRELVEIAFACVDLDWHDYVIINPKFYRPAESVLMQGDFSKARRELGWQPTTSFAQMIERMVAADLQAAKEGNYVAT